MTSQIIHSTFSQPIPKSFLHISSDNRIHLWDIVTRKSVKYIDKNHLSHQFTCFAWNNSKSSLCVGFSDGVIIVWDLSRGVVAKTVGDNNSPTPSAIIYSNDSSSIFVSFSTLNSISQFCLKTGNELKSIPIGKKGATKMIINPKIDILAVSSGSAIKIIDTNSGKKKKLDSSFSGGVNSFSFSSCGCFLIASSSRGSRELLLFDIRADASSTPIVVLAVLGLPISIDMKSDEEKQLLEVLVLFEDKGGCVFQIHSNYNEMNNMNIDLIKGTTQIISTEEILSGYLGEVNKVRGGSAGEGVVVAVGKASNPNFKHINTTDSTGNILDKIDVNISTTPLDSNNNSNDSSKDSNNKAVLKSPSVIGPYEMGGIKRPLQEDDEEEEDEEAEKSKRARNDLTISSQEEMTLEQKLESLSNRVIDFETVSNIYTNPFQTITSDSLVVLVEQALQSSDDSLLEQCLSCGDIDIIDATANRLPTNRIVTLLRKLVAKFEKRPSRGILVTRWLSSLLRHHTSFLITIPDLSFQLAGLSQMLEQRLSSYTKLSSLAGRLDLLLSQVVYQPAHNYKAAKIPLHIHNDN